VTQNLRVVPELSQRRAAALIELLEIQGPTFGFIAAFDAADVVAKQLVWRWIFLGRRVAPSKEAKCSSAS
jgi:hypothetical protein